MDIFATKKKNTQFIALPIRIMYNSMY